MALTEYKQGSVIGGKGDPFNQLSLIIKGDAESALNGEPFHYEKGDIIGLADLETGVHSFTYTAATDVTVITYPYGGIDAMDTLLRGSADLTNHMVNSMCHQISEIMLYRAALKREAGKAYEMLIELYKQYERLSTLYALTPKKMPGLDNVKPFSGPDPTEDWVGDYYIEINGMDTGVRKSFFSNNHGISSGFLRRSAQDIIRAAQACDAYQQYITGLSWFYLNGEAHDMFSLISDLHYNSLSIKGADAAVEELMGQLNGLMSYLTGIDYDNYQQRQSAYREALGIRRSTQETATDAPGTSGVKRNLSDSLDVILEYSGCPEELCNRFKQYVIKYTKLPDRGSSDDDVRTLRKELTTLFYEIYQSVFFKRLNDTAPSTIIKMFLNFGYVDAALAGHENADYLYSISDSLRGDPDMGVFTVSEWLTAIYNGQKEPSRNEFDMDYAEHLRDMKTKGSIDAKEEARMLADLEGKVRFEIQNVFPIVNKITFGRISIFCPLFASHNVFRKLENSLVTPALVREKLDELISVDYSAYCREILYSNDKCGISNEYLHIEVLPNIILMPNVGSRGSLWQEIEGRNRATPARMFMPVFLESELKAMVIQLTGEFRWEMCKRIQGSRWNDVTTPSLTSMYCDYLQFYKNNRDLSSETKEAIKIEFERAKRNYKQVFVSNYAEWLTYEINGSPRLNKVALSLMIEYCPFSAPIREKLLQHPRYSELLNRYNIKLQRRVQHMQSVIQLAGRVVKQMPQELLDEFEYTKK